MLQTLNQSPGLTALVSAIALGAAITMILFLIERGQDAKRRRERRILLERLDREAQTIQQLQTELATSRQELNEHLRAMDERQDRLRSSMEARMESMERSNDYKLTEMRQTVSEKLESTLNSRLGASFKTVNEQLHQVHEGLGEMQALAASVGDLKRVLTNVKTRGVWGEVRLRALLQETLAPGQYLENVQADPASQERVEFALKLPAVDGDGPILPMDSKFPQEDYLRLVDALEAGDAAQVAKCRQQLEKTVLEQAKKISDKYIRPPRTTDFAILFLPIESLYAEVLLSPGLAEKAQSRYRVMITGPNALMALLNSLQMGFRACQLERRSGEILELLDSVRAEFTRFGDSLQKARQRIQQAEGDLDAVDTRARAINRQLKRLGEEDAK